jgi:ParB family chromosome partitioning protein
MSELSKELSNKKSRLGRGLGSLLGANAEIEETNTVSAPQPKTTLPEPQPTKVAEIKDDSKVWQVAIEKLIPGKSQPRTNFDKEALTELADSIKQQGILQPILVKKNSEGKFEIIAGERRWRAAQLAGLFEVPVLVKELTDKQSLEIAVIENIQREDLNPIEEALAYQRLIQEFTLTQAEVSERVGKDRVTITNALRLLNLSPLSKQMLIEKQLSAGHAKVLLALEDHDLLDNLAKQTVKNGWSVRKLENEVKSAKAPKSIESIKTNTTTTILIDKIKDDLQKTAGTKVDIEYKDGKGSIKIHFYNNEELNKIVELIKR